jgi:hypothetical protein
MKIRLNYTDSGTGETDTCDLDNAGGLNLSAIVTHINELCENQCVYGGGYSSFLRDDKTMGFIIKMCDGYFGESLWTGTAKIVEED